MQDLIDIFLSGKKSTWRAPIMLDLILGKESIRKERLYGSLNPLSPSFSFSLSLSHAFI